MAQYIIILTDTVTEKGITGQYVQVRGGSYPPLENKDERTPAQELGGLVVKAILEDQL